MSARAALAAVVRYARAERAVYQNAIDGYAQGGHWQTPPDVYDEHEAAEAAVPYWLALVIGWYIPWKLRYLRRTGQS